MGSISVQDLNNLFMLLLAIQVAVLICFFILCSDVSKIRKHLVDKSSKPDDGKDDDSK